MKEEFEPKQYVVTEDSVINLIHVAVVTASSPEELQENLNDMTTYVQCEQKGTIDDIKLTVNDFGGKLNYTAIITYYHTLMEVDGTDNDGMSIINEEIIYSDEEEE